MVDYTTATVCVFLLFGLCTVTSFPAVPNEDLEDIRIAAREMAARNSNEPMSQEEIQRLLLKKLRFRDLDEDIVTPEEAMQLLEQSDAHRASKRHKMGDLVSRLHALLSDMKVRQIKEALQLPSLRFGRSGLNLKY